ncbi:hypothetical protein [Thaumasiovibrio sp. DFM-14]|uniref:hypothetical protein n=1 Tax=Thaumasiovibrio sp. DFM-14 TaxID=3384792 RepID=UPI0039A01116
MFLLWSFQAGICAEVSVDFDAVLSKNGDIELAYWHFCQVLVNNDSITLCFDTITVALLQLTSLSYVTSYMLEKNCGC